MQVLLGEKEYFKGLARLNMKVLKAITHLHFAGMMKIKWLQEKH